MTFLSALACQNRSGRVPLWLMRQAGRYLPDYKIYREKASLLELFHDPQSIVQITRLPLKTLPLDAAILFSDILTVLDGLGVAYTFDPGPKISFSGFQRKKNSYSHIKEAIVTLKEQLDVPLIGFAGAPFTIASYLIEEQTTKTFLKMKRFLFTRPKEFEAMLNVITEETIAYLHLQIEAGVDAIQLFDSWACHIGPAEFKKFSLPYLQQIVEEIRPHIPIIIFAKGSHAMATATLKPSAISLDWSYNLPRMRGLISREIALQGNLDPSLLYAEKSVIKEAVDRLLDTMKHEPGYIFNLGHGMLPDIPFENVEFLVNYVRSAGL